MEKRSIFFGQPIFSQMVNLLDKAKIDKRVRLLPSDRYYKRFGTFQHLVTMFYGLTSGCNFPLALLMPLLSCALNYFAKCFSKVSFLFFLTIEFFLQSYASQ